MRYNVIQLPRAFTPRLAHEWTVTVGARVWLRDRRAVVIALGREPVRCVELDVAGPYGRYTTWATLRVIRPRAEDGLEDVYAGLPCDSGPQEAS